ncbi:glycosyltransferase [Halomonas sediminis]
MSNSPEPQQPPKVNARVQVIIPTYNAAPYLEDLLPALTGAAQLQPLDVMFVDSSSTDGTPERIQQAGFQLQQIKKATFDHGGTRAMAARQTSADIVVFMTQDALLVDEYAISKLIAAFEDPQVAAAYGRQLAYPGTNIFGQHLRAFNYPSQSIRRTWEDRTYVGLKAAFLSNSFAAYRRSAMQEIGWFSDGLILGEDTQAAARLLQRGGAIQYVADACVYHSHSYRIIEEFRRYFDIGAFHSMNPWLLEAFGKAEGEGMRYIRSELQFLNQHKKLHKVPEFILRSGMKYLGYRLGRSYRSLSPRVIQTFSMHAGWWRKASPNQMNSNGLS